MDEMILTGFPIITSLVRIPTVYVSTKSIAIHSVGLTITVYKLCDGVKTIVWH